MLPVRSAAARVPPAARSTVTGPVRSPIRLTVNQTSFSPALPSSAEISGETGAAPAGSASVTSMRTELSGSSSSSTVTVTWPSAVSCPSETK